MTVRLDVSYYYVGNIDEASQVYSHLLACEPAVHEQDWVRFDLEGGSLAFHLDPDLPKAVSEAPVRFGAVVSITVPDVQQAVERVTRHGFRQHGEVLSQPYGKLAEIRDPWGNRLSLIEPLVTDE
jgi:predicted enzyme related to lactoylglutathione lyase